MNVQNNPCVFALRYLYCLQNPELIRVGPQNGPPFLLAFYRFGIVERMKGSQLERNIAALAGPVIEDKGFRLIGVTFKGGTLQIMAEDPATRRLGVDDCAMLSREISTLLEVEDPIRGAYRLEISSPGIDRPLVALEDFATYEGFEAKIEIDPPREDGRKRFRGRLTGTEGNDILLETDQGPVTLPFAAIDKAKLVLTDDLIKQTANTQD